MTETNLGQYLIQAGSQIRSGLIVGSLALALSVTFGSCVGSCIGNKQEITVKIDNPTAVQREYDHQRMINDALLKRIEGLEKTVEYLQHNDHQE